MVSIRKKTDKTEYEALGSKMLVRNVGICEYVNFHHME